MQLLTLLLAVLLCSLDAPANLQSYGRHACAATTSFWPQLECNASCRHSRVWRNPSQQLYRWLDWKYTTAQPAMCLNMQMRLLPQLPIDGTCTHPISHSTLLPSQLAQHTSFQLEQHVMHV